MLAGIAIRAARLPCNIHVRSRGAVVTRGLAWCGLILASGARITYREARAVRDLTSSTVRAARRASFIAIRAGFALTARVIPDVRVSAIQALIASSTIIVWYCASAT